MELPVSELRPGDHIEIPRLSGVQKAGMKALISEIGPSRMSPDLTRIVTTRTAPSSHVVVLPNDLLVIVTARGVNQSTKVRCRCTNHMGTQKVLFKSREAAVEALMRRHLRHGTHRIYPCPTVEGRFHITSKKERVHDPKG
jgi:hypothetical protein